MGSWDLAKLRRVRAAMFATMTSCASNGDRKGAMKAQRDVEDLDAEIASRGES